MYFLFMSLKMGWGSTDLGWTWLGLALCCELQVCLPSMSLLLLGHLAMMVAEDKRAHQHSELMSSPGLIISINIPLDKASHVTKPDP